MSALKMCKASMERKENTLNFFYRNLINTAIFFEVKRIVKFINTTSQL